MTPIPLNYYYSGSDFYFPLLYSSFFTWDPETAQCSNSQCTKLKSRQTPAQTQMFSDTNTNAYALLVDFPSLFWWTIFPSHILHGLINLHSFCQWTCFFCPQVSICQALTNIKKGDKSTSYLTTERSGLLTGIHFWLLLHDGLDLSEAVLKVTSYWLFWHILCVSQKPLKVSVPKTSCDICSTSLILEIHLKGKGIPYCLMPMWP